MVIPGNTFLPMPEGRGFHVEEYVTVLHPWTKQKTNIPIGWTSTENIQAVRRRLAALLTPAKPVIGRPIMWNSPQYGLLTGVVLAISSRTITVLHPLSGIEATIPKQS
jgi:hypothetical protein